MAKTNVVVGEAKIRRRKSRTVALWRDVSLHGGRWLGAIIWVEGEKETEGNYHY